MGIRRVARPISLTDFVADDAAYNGTADGSDRTATSKNGTTDGTDSSADGGILILSRHVGTTKQAKQHDCGYCANREFMH